MWLGDQRKRLWANLLAYGQPVVMTTITAPSMAWDPTFCTHGAGEKCSGAIGCRVEATRARDFNLRASKAYSAMHHAAKQAVDREFGRGVLRRLAYAPELQARGVVHWHVVLGAGSPREKWAAEMYVRHLARLAPGYDYGFVDRGKPCRWRGRTPVRFKLEERPSWVAANYLSKYLTKVDGAGLRELVVKQEAPPRAVYVDRTLTGGPDGTRVTMRNLRLKRAIYVAWRVEVSAAEAEAVWGLLRAFDGVLMEGGEPVFAAGTAGGRSP